MSSIDPILEMLGSLGIAACCFDAEDHIVAWNQCLFRLFPEHAGHMRVGEPYAENLRRFYGARLNSEEMQFIDRYIADGIERHRNQFQPFEFCHHGQWLRVASLPIKGRGRARIWTPIAAPTDGETLAVSMVNGGQRPALDGTAHIADGLLVCDPQGLITFSNTRFAEIYQFDPAGSPRDLSFEDVLTRVWGGHCGAADALDAVRDHLRFPGVPFAVPLPGDRWIRCCVRRGQDGSQISTHADITQMHRAQRDAAEARERAEMLAESLREKIMELEAANRQNELLLTMMPGALVRVRYRENAPMEALYRSPKSAELTGFSFAEMKDGLLGSRMSQEDRLRLRSKVRESLTTGGETSMEVDFQHANGNWRRMHAAIRAVPDSAGSDEVVMLCTDVTDERMRLIQDAQASRLLTLGEMASGIAHELNQPLSTIALLTETAAMELRHNPGATDVVLGKLARLGEQSLRAGRIIHTLHDMTRPASATLAPVCLRRVVAQTRLLVDQLMRNAAINVVEDWPEDLPAVLADEMRVQQTLMNLFSNARDAMARSNPARPTIRISAQARNGAISLSVADNGGGVDEAVIGRVFDPFFTTKGPDKGTGLGLSIARSAIRSMNGDIAVHNQNGGAVFTLNLRPASQPAFAAAAQ